MRKTKYYTSGLLIVFLMLYILSVFQLDFSTTYHYNLNLNADNNAESWSRIIKPGRRLYSPSIELIDNHTYIIGNIGEKYTDFDIYVAKINSSGVKLWEQTWGGSEFNHLKDYIVDSENNFYIVGISNTFYINDRGSIFLLKYNTTGNLLWSKTIDPFSSNYYEIHSIQTDLNDSIYISCTMYTSTNDKTSLIKLDTSGNILWTQEIEQIIDPSFLITQIDSDGNFYLYSKCWDINSFLLKLNSSGSRLWCYEWGEGEYGYDLKLDLDDNIIVTGISHISYRNYEVWIMKINNSGNLTKKIIFASFMDWPKVDVWFLDNIYILTGSSLLKYNYSLNHKWNFTFGSHLRIDDSKHFNFGITSQYEMYLIYIIYGDISILRFNSSGAIFSNFKWGGSYYDYLHDIGIDSQDNLYMLCTIKYVNIWKESTDLTILVKNPKSDGKAPQLDQLIDGRDIFIFSLLGVMCFISVILVYKTLKPKFR